MKTIKCEGEDLSLPVEFSKPLVSLQDASMLLYGEKKIGKTSFCAEFPETFIMLCEPGGKWLKLKSKPVENWRQFRAYLKLLKSQPTKFRTVVVDTVDRAYKMCYRHICDEIGIDHPSEEGYSKAWQMIADEFADQINFLLSLNRGVIFISHAEEKEIKVKSGNNTTRITETMPKQARKILEAVVDIWAYYRYRNDEREVVIRGNETIGAGVRLTENFKGIRTIPMGDSPHEGYLNFISAFNNEARWKQKAKIKIKLKGD